MAVIEARQSALPGNIVSLCLAQAGTGDTTNTADRGPRMKINSTKIRFSPAIGATPTCTYQIQVSPDGTNWVNATYADVTAPGTDASTTFVLTSDAVVEKIIKHPTVWRYIKVTFSANTNVTNTVDVVFDDQKRWF